ncbi:MAG TPA: sigma-70 family RNA polymerase sigma factor [Opitutaceae bacterium]|jgi:RNA polymerase sigma factor (sigma-70 family)
MPIAMADLDDAALIRRYLSERSEPDFTALVQRHLPMVRRAALRLTDGNGALADEIAQAVFVCFASKLPRLAHHPALTGWLHATTRYAASETLRAARRRHNHELEAQRMSPMNQEGGDSGTSWARIQPELDAALRGLGKTDREAVLLRYFEDRPLGSIAAQLGLKEDAARMRIRRALVRLRRTLASRGILTTEAALTMFLETDRAVAAAAVPPAACAALAHGALVAVPPVAPSALLLSKLTTTAIAMKKSLIIAGLVGALVGGASTFYFGRRHVSALYRESRGLQVQNDRLRDQITRSLLSGGGTVGAKTAPGTSPGSPATAEGVTGLEARLDRIGSDVTLREASRDAMPTEVAHPLKFRGYDTPLEAFESYVWANYMTDPEMVARSLYFDSASRAAVEKIRLTLSPQMQALYPTAESLVGMLFAYDSIDYPGPNSEDVLVDPPQPKYLDADDIQTPNGMVLHRTTGGWKVSMRPDIAVFVKAQLHPSGS